MNLTITKEAASHLQNELNLEQGAYVRFYVKYGGHSTIQTGFSLGISTDRPNRIGASYETNGVLFYVEEADLWYFENYNLNVDYNDKTEEIEYHYL